MIRWIAASTGLMLVMVGAACQAPAPQATSTPTAATTRPPTTVAQAPSPSTAASPPVAASPAAAASPSVAAASPTPRAAASPAAAAPPPAGASRVEVLNAANAAFGRGDLPTAAGLYERVLNTPTSGEQASATAAINDFAYFRDAVTLLAAGREDEAKAQLDALQKADPSSPLARLGSQLWDQYGMIGSLRGACAQLQPQIASQAGPELSALAALGVSVEPQSVCSPPAS